MRNNRKRRDKMRAIFVCVSLLNGFYVGAVTMILVQQVACIYITISIPYAFRKTRICPLEIMCRTPVWRWSRAFRLMYRNEAPRMMRIYFTAAVVVVAKVSYLLWMGVKWASHWWV